MRQDFDRLRISRAEDGLHILFGVYVAVRMWAGLVLRRPALLGMLLGRR
jgi:hypothetical protein